MYLYKYWGSLVQEKSTGAATKKARFLYKLMFYIQFQKHI